MMLVGRIAKLDSPLWYAEVEAVGAYTQGTSREEAKSMLAGAIESMVDRRGFKITVTELGRSKRGVIDVVVQANDPIALAERVITYHREFHGKRARRSVARRRRRSAA